VYDLASHDVSIFNWLLGSRPLVVSAVGEAFLQEGIEDIAFISLRYPMTCWPEFTLPGLIRRKSAKSRSSAPENDHVG
jgi:predicted dehydrogenase